ncbi:MAG TPA: hypothetical protein VFN27_16895 [Xanthobacteraceae bacterium]|nr:hypothetical protein [Xanthobacteraceae bacterium]
MGSYVGPVAAIAGTGLKAYGDYEKGAGEQAADEMQAAQLRRKAEYAGAAAAETNATLTDRLATTLGNIDVVRAAAHADPSSPTTLALRSRAATVGNQERAIRVGNILAQQSEDLASADYLTSAGKFALNMGKLSAAADILNAGGQTNPNLFGMPGSPGGGGGSSSDPTQIGALY